MTGTHVGVTALLSMVVGWFVFDGIASLVSLPAFYAELGVSSEGVPWFLLWSGVVLPVVFYAVAVVVARRQPMPRFTIVLITALAATAAVRLSIIAIATGSIVLTA